MKKILIAAATMGSAVIAIGLAIFMIDDRRNPGGVVREREPASRRVESSTRVATAEPRARAVRRIEGLTLTPAGAPVAGAHVRLSGGDRVLASAVTDSLGKFVLRHVAREPLPLLRVGASADGYQDESAEVQPATEWIGLIMVPNAARRSDSFWIEIVATSGGEPVKDYDVAVMSTHELPTGHPVIASATSTSADGKVRVPSPMSSIRVTVIPKARYKSWTSGDLDVSGGTSSAPFQVLAGLERGAGVFGRLIVEDWQDWPVITIGAFPRKSGFADVTPLARVGLAGSKLRNIGLTRFLSVAVNGRETGFEIAGLSEGDYSIAPIGPTGDSLIEPVDVTVPAKGRVGPINLAIAHGVNVNVVVTFEGQSVPCRVTLYPTVMPEGRRQPPVSVTRWSRTAVAGDGVVSFASVPPGPYVLWCEVEPAASPMPLVEQVPEGVLSALSQLSIHASALARDSLVVLVSGEPVGLTVEISTGCGKWEEFKSLEAADRLYEKGEFYSPHEGRFWVVDGQFKLLNRDLAELRDSGATPGRRLGVALEAAAEERDLRSLMRMLLGREDPWAKR